MCTRWFKYDRDDLCVNKSQFVPVIFEPPCILLHFLFRGLFTDTKRTWNCKMWKLVRINWKWYERKRCWPNLSYIGIRMEALRRTTKSFVQGGRHPRASQKHDRLTPLFSHTGTHILSQLCIHFKINKHAFTSNQLILSLPATNTGSRLCFRSLYKFGFITFILHLPQAYAV